MKEEWRDIKDYDKLYQVSSMGRVRSKDRRTYIGDHSRTYKGRILKNQKTATGYLKVFLSKNGKVIQYQIHRLVAETFIMNESNKPQVNHINGCTKDNKLNNLEWCTAKENAQHALRTGLIKVGEDNTQCKITNNQVANIRLWLGTDCTAASIARAYSISDTHIHHIKYNTRRSV